MVDEWEAHEVSQYTERRIATQGSDGVAFPGYLLGSPTLVRDKVKGLNPFNNVFVNATIGSPCPACPV